MKSEPKSNLDKNDEINNILQNLSSIYSSISEGFTKVTKYLSQYQLLKEKNKDNQSKTNNMIDLTGNEDNTEKNNNKKTSNENKNNLIIVLNNSTNSSNNKMNNKEKINFNKENKIDKMNIDDNLIAKTDEDLNIINKDKENGDKIGNEKTNKNWEFNTFFKKLHVNFKNNSKKRNKSEIKLPINNINNYYFKEINITNNNNIKKSRSELKNKKEKNKNKKISYDKKEIPEKIKDKNENHNIINLDEEEEKKLKEKQSVEEKSKNKKSNSKGYKFKIKFLDYCYVFGYYQSYNDAFYDKVHISKFFNEIDLFSLNFNEQFSYKNISIKLKEKYPLISVKYIKNSINHENKIKGK